MSPVRIRTLLLLLVLGVAIGVLVTGIRARFGMDRPVSIVRPGACQVLRGPRGAEDLQIDDAGRRAILAAVDRRDPEAQGDLWSLDLTDPSAQPVRIERDGPERFRPMGLSLVRTDRGLRVWVVNVAGEQPSVEAFDLVDGAAQHRATVRGEGLTTPNDVAAVDAERFYVSNDHGTPPGPARLMEDLLGLNLSDVRYWDGARFTIADDDLSYADGVSLSRDGSQLIVAQMMPGTLTWLDRVPQTGVVAQHLLVDLDTGVDDMNIAADGSVWVAGHTRLFDLLAHVGDPAHLSPTEVYRVTRVGSSARIDRVFADDGRMISAGSSAAAWGHVLLISSAFDDSLVRCALPDELAVPVTGPGSGSR